MLCPHPGLSTLCSFFLEPVLAQAVLAQVPQAVSVEAGFSCCRVLLLLADPFVQVGARPWPGWGVQPFSWKHQDREHDGRGRGASGAETAQGNLCQFLAVRNSRPAGLSSDRARLLFALMLLQFSLSHPPTHEPSLFQESGVGQCPLAPSPALPAHAHGAAFPASSMASTTSAGSIGRVPLNSLSKEISEPPAAFPAAPAPLVQPCAPLAAARGGMSLVLPGVFET